MKIEIWSHHGDSTWYTQPIWPKFGRFFCLCTTSPPIWLQISSHFGQFCVPFISPKHNKAVEFFGLFSKLGWEGFLKKFNEKLEANSAASRVFQKFFLTVTVLQPGQLSYMILVLNKSMKFFFGQIHNGGSESAWLASFQSGKWAS